MKDLPTASGAITIRTADGTPVGHGWGEVRVRRDPRTGGSSVIGEIRQMTWAPELPPQADRQTYSLHFYGGPSFVGTFDEAFPDASRRGATFHPSGMAPAPNARPLWAP